ncbi:MAG TPA: DUF87 domain-containing protein [Ktedonobacterales bacterium]|nr:DUF87 domain-containing protein [Ktedonobacterales bacterium]
MATVTTQSNPVQQSSKAVRRPRFPLRASERWGIVGKTGSGKSAFARWMLKRWRKAGWRILIVDPYLRWSEGFAEKPEEATLDKPFVLKTPALIKNSPVMLYRPTLPAYRDEGLNQLMFQAVAEGGVVVCFDEGKSVSTANFIMPGVGECFTAGRKSPLPVLFLTQTPKRIHTDILGQCEWIVVFRQNRPQDRDYMAEWMGDTRVGGQIPNHAFWLKHEDDDGAQLMQPLPEAEIR